jgi:hypothetical protein
MMRVTSTRGGAAVGAGPGGSAAGGEPTRPKVPGRPTRSTASVVVIPAAGLLLYLGLLGCSRNCKEIKEEARALRNSHVACRAGDSCQVVNLYELAGADNCLAALQCGAAFRAGVDLQEFRRRAADLVSDYEACRDCEMAGCPGIRGATARCNEAQGMCEIVQPPYPYPPDAGDAAPE